MKKFAGDQYYSVTQPTLLNCEGFIRKYAPSLSLTCRAKACRKNNYGYWLFPFEQVKYSVGILIIPVYTYTSDKDEKDNLITKLEIDLYLPASHQ